MSNNKIPTALEFLHRDESGVYNEVDIVQAMDGYAKLHVEQIKQFLHNEICERRDYSASKMCEEVLKFIEQMKNNKQEQKQLLVDIMNDDAKDGLYENKTLNQLIKLYEDQITELTVLSKIELGDDVIEETNRLKSQLLGGDNMNNNPGNTSTDNPLNMTLNMTVLREYITMYLDDVETYGDEKELDEATTVLYDFMMYVNSMRGWVEGETDEDEQTMDEYNQSIDEYNEMEEKWEMDNYKEIQNQIMEDMTGEQRAMMQLVSVLDDIQLMVHELTLDERNELIDELTHLYERYNIYASTRRGDKQE